jgi:hypothetical protein
LPTFCNEGIATEFAAYEHYLDNLAFLAKESRPAHVVGVWRASKKNWLPTPNGVRLAGTALLARSTQLAAQPVGHLSGSCLLYGRRGCLALSKCSKYYETVLRKKQVKKRVNGAVLTCINKGFN